MTPGQIRSISAASLACAVLFAGILCRAQSQAQNPPPQKKAEEQKKEEQQDYTEEEYDAYEKATKETDLLKKPDLLIGFMDKYPKSKLQIYIVNDYEALMAKYYEEKDYKTLGALAERWMKYRPDDIKTWVYIFVSARALNNDAKVIEYGEKIFTKQPSPNLAYILYESYDKLGNLPKRNEWRLKLLEYPEFNDNFKLRLDLMAECATAKDDAKAAFWAEQVLKSLSLAKKPPDASEADWNKTVKTVQKTSYEVIGANQVREKKWAETIQTNKRLLQLEVYDVPLFNIAWAEWQTGDLDNAKLHFAMAEYCAGALKAKSTEYFEQLYKSQQNNTLIGVERYRKRAQAEVEALKVKK